MWLWARKNADITGLLGNADKEDVANAIAPHLDASLNSEKVADALIAEGWIDEADGCLYVHDWYEWQQYWYNYLDKKEKDKVRKRLEREKARSDTQREEQPPDPAPEAPEETKQEEKPKKPQKTKYGDEVRMYPEEYQKLVDAYGEKFAEMLVTELDNYKVANGKRYKDDYRAILNWAVEKCEKKYPQLVQRRSEPRRQSDGKNPFDDYK